MGRPNRQSRTELDSSSVSAEFKHARGRLPAILTFSRSSRVGDPFLEYNFLCVRRGYSCCFSTLEDGRGCWKSGFEACFIPAFVVCCRAAADCVAGCRLFFLFFLTRTRTTTPR